MPVSIGAKGSASAHGSASAVTFDAALTNGSTLSAIVFTRGTLGTPWNMGSTTLAYKGAVLTSPAGVGWTQTQLNGAQARVGFSGNSTTDPFWDALLLEVEYPDDGQPYIT